MAAPSFPEWINHSLRTSRGGERTNSSSRSRSRLVASPRFQGRQGQQRASLESVGLTLTGVVRHGRALTHWRSCSSRPDNRLTAEAAAGASIPRDARIAAAGWLQGCASRFRRQNFPRFLVPRLCLGTHCLAGSACRVDKTRGRASHTCLLYTSDAADDLLCVDLGGRRII